MQKKYPDEYWKYSEFYIQTDDQKTWAELFFTYGAWYDKLIHMYYIFQNVYVTVSIYLIKKSYIYAILFKKKSFQPQHYM